MARVKRGVTSRARHKSIYQKTKGFKHGRKNLIKVAKQAAVRAGQNAYRGRKARKRYFRSLWIVRLNAACRQNGIRYNEFISLLQKKEINLNRKVLSELAQKDPEKFSEVVARAKS